jgi:hypothetical protein
MMQGFDTRFIYGQKLVPISWEQAVAIMKPKAQSDDYYSIAVHALSACALIFADIQRRVSPQNLAAVCSLWKGHPFIVCAIRELDLPRAEYGEIVRGRLGLDTKLDEGCCDLWAPRFAIEAGSELAVNLLTDHGAKEELAMEA